MRPLILLALLGLVPALASAQDTPRRKSGLWEISMSMAGLPTPMVTRQCVDEKNDDLGRHSSSGAPERCSKNSVRREGGRVIVESVCRVEGSTATTRAVFSGDFTSSYKGEIDTRFAPPLDGRAESKMGITARLTGPCAPGQKPGEAAMPAGPAAVSGDARKMMEDARSGNLDPEQARRMAEEMRRQYQK